MGESPFKYSLFGLGAFFALLGGAVLVRRPNLQAAREFSLFAWSAGVAFIVSPASGGPAPAWSLVVQFLGLPAVGATALPLGISLGSHFASPRVSRFARLWAFIGIGIALFYLIAFFLWSPLYTTVRAAGLLYLSASLIGMVAVLVAATVRTTTYQVRVHTAVVLWGIAAGALPLVVLTLIPESLGKDSLLPVHLTVLGTFMVPLAFADAILQHQLWDIRRLFHRGMVYGTMFVILTIAVSVLATVTVRATDVHYDLVSSPGMLVGTSMLAVIAFLLLERPVRWSMDRLIYRHTATYEQALGMFQAGLSESDNSRATAASFATSISQVLGVESVCIFLGDGVGTMTLAGAAGPRAGPISASLAGEVARDGYLPRDIQDIRIGPHSILVSPLRSGERLLGLLAVGPKNSGEVFMDDERRLTRALVPLLALAMEKNLLSETLRALNEQLITASETERARFAADIHDGPLQKAILLSGALGQNTRNHDELARELVLELREISARLRPSVLDDLGLVPAIEWVLERTGLQTELLADDVNTDIRLPPDVELALFRVTQEAVNNVVKHAHATEVRVHMALTNQCAELQVKDNGVGISPTRTFGFGLTAMRERIAQYQGTLHIASAPHEGTTVSIVLPIRARQAAK
jgi:signal transduction histidine kinase